MNKAELVAQQLLGGNLNKIQWGSAMYNVLVEGLAGGGVVDDTAKLQVLVDKAIAEGRKAIFFPHGTNGQYRVTTLTNADQVVFFGDNATFVGGYTGEILQLGKGGVSQVEFDTLETTVNTLNSEFTAHEAETVTGVYNALGHGLVGSGTVDDYTALAALLTTIGSNKATILFSVGTYKLSSNITIPSNVTLWFLNGAMLSPDIGVTLTINGPINAGEYQIFSGSGTVLGSPRVASVSPCWFGAKNDGTDISGAVNKSIQFLPNTGGKVKFGLGGWWTLSNPINVNRAAVRLSGQGTGNSTNIRAATHNFTMINVTSPDCIIDNLSLSAATYGTAGAYAISITAGRAKLRDIEITGCDNGISLDGANIDFQDIRIESLRPAAGVGIKIDTAHEVMDFNSITMENGVGNDAYAGFLILGGAGIQISNCDLQKMGRPMAIIPTARSVFSVSVDNTFFDTSSGTALDINAAVGFAVVRSRFSNCWFSSCDRGVSIRADAQGIIFDGCEFYDNNKDGIRVYAGANVRGLIVSASQFGGNRLCGIAIEAGVSNFIIKGNYVGQTGGFPVNANGIVIDAGASNHYVIADNISFGNTSGQLTDGGTGVNKSVNGNVTA